MGEPHPLVERLHELRNDRRLGSVLLACLAIAAGLAWLRSSADGSRSPGPASAPAGVGSSRPAYVATSASSLPALVVDVVGAVRASGVVRMPAGARVIDAIAAAGGATRDADVQQLNLAAHLTDGERIAVPHRGETLPTPTAGPDPNSIPEGPVDLNTASPAELDALPGIGPATATAIVRNRDEHGPSAASTISPGSAALDPRSSNSCAIS